MQKSELTMQDINELYQEVSRIKSINRLLNPNHPEEDELLDANIRKLSEIESLVEASLKKADFCSYLRLVR